MKYESLKSLISLRKNNFVCLQPLKSHSLPEGHIDTTMLNFVVVCFQHGKAKLVTDLAYLINVGSTSLKVDLIKHLLKFEILKFLPKVNCMTVLCIKPHTRAMVHSFDTAAL